MAVCSRHQQVSIPVASLSCLLQLPVYRASSGHHDSLATKQGACMRRLRLRTLQLCHTGLQYLSDHMGMVTVAEDHVSSPVTSSFWLL